MMKNIKMYLLAMALFVTSACDKDFDEVNTNPNVPLQVTPNLLLSGIIQTPINRMVEESWSIGNTVVQHTAKIQFVNDDRYLWGERSGLWITMYGKLRDVNNLMESASKSVPVQNNYLGIGLIMKSWMFSILTDAYGDIPYSEATQGKSNSIFQPKYDTQESVYAGILADLKKGSELLGTSSEAVSGDILYAGKLDNWQKLANSLRLRYLMRISNRRDVSADIKAILDNPTQYPVFTSNDDNAALKYLTAAPNQWPMYTSRSGGFDEFRLSKNLGDKLTALNDPRLAVFGRPTEKSIAAGAPKIEGIPNGLGDVPALNYNGGPQGVSRVGLTFACQVCNDNGALPVADASRGLLMTYAELQFILAEAAEKGLITGNAETYYLNGINANFDYYKSIVPAQYNINVTPPASYFTQESVAYTGAKQEKLVKIGTQKWIALFFNGLESWFDWRRTGIPTLIPGSDNLNDGKIPVRYIYPLNEQSLNPTNRAAAVTKQGEDNINTPVWWDK